MSSVNYISMDPCKLMARLGELAHDPRVNAENTSLYKDWCASIPDDITAFLNVEQDVIDRAYRASDELGDAKEIYTEIECLTDWLSLAIKGEMCGYAENSTEARKYAQAQQ